MGFPWWSFVFIFCWSCVWTFNDRILLFYTNLSMRGNQIATLLLYLLLTIAFSGKSEKRLYIGDNNSTALLKKGGESIIGILFTNKHCKDCISYEQEYVSLISTIEKEYKIEIYRCELSLNPHLQQQFSIKRFPMLHFVISQHKSYSIYHNYQLTLLNQAQSTLKKLQYYIEKAALRTTSDELILNIERLEYIQQQEIIKLYGLNSLFQQLPVIRFLNKQTFVAQIRQRGIDEHQISSCLIYHSVFHRCFSPISHTQQQYLFSMTVFQRVVEFTESTYKMYQSLELNRYVFVAVLDSIFDRAGSQNHIDMLNGLLRRREFRGKITIFWMQTQINRQKLEHLGFKSEDRPPLFALFSLTDPIKKVLKDGNKAIFDQKSIISFMKKIIQFDQSEQIKIWNKQLLTESLRRLKLSKSYQIISSSNEITKANPHFVLALPYVELELLTNNQIFYETLLNYRFLIERIRRFSNIRDISQSLIFQQLVCDSKPSYGLFIFHSQGCKHLSKQLLFSHAQAAPYIQSYFNLPQFFYINENDYEQHLSHQLRSAHKIVQFEHVFIDI